MITIKHTLQRMLAVILLLAMTASLLSPAWAEESAELEVQPSLETAGSDPDPEKPDWSDAIDEDDPAESEDDQVIPDDGNGESLEDQVGEVSAREASDLPGEEDPDPAEEAGQGEEPNGDNGGTLPEQTPEDPEDSDIPEEEAREVFVLDIGETHTLSLQYDDYYSFSAMLPGYVILSVDEQQIMSAQVVGGAKTNLPDTQVLRLQEGSDTGVIASGVGSAAVLLVKPEDYEAAQQALEQQTVPEQPEDDAQTQQPEEEPDGEPDEAAVQEIAVPVVRVEVTVTPATLTVIMLTGQSNNEGVCSSLEDYYPEDSVMCPLGQVYSTILPVNQVKARYISGIASLPAASLSNLDQHLPGSLTGTASLAGSDLIYPLYALTEKGRGKTGPDGGIAYEWNRMSGDKVWIINAAWGGSSVAQWEPGMTCYQRAAAAFTKCLDTAQAEIDAGHYTWGRKLMFWQQGETSGNLKMEAGAYLSAFSDMRQGFISSCGVEYFGIISVRANKEHTSVVDLSMTTPRIAQYYMGTSPAYPNVFVVSNVNEQWVSDREVQEYFRAAYPGGKLSYPLRSGASLGALPCSVEEIHPNVHYKQVGHNENGITAARGMYAAVNHLGLNTPQSVVWRNAGGKACSSMKMLIRDTAVICPVVFGDYFEKDLRVVCTSGLSYYPASGQVQSTEAGAQALYLVDSQNREVSRLPIQVWQCKTPEVSILTNVVGGVKVSWGKVAEAEGYCVLRRTDSEDWQAIGTTTNGTLTDTTAKSGTTYTYTVRCITGDGTYSSNVDNQGKSIIYIAAPVLSKLENKDGGVKLSWAKCNGAAKYRVFRKMENGNWTKLAETTGLTYTDKTAEEGCKYFYTVRCISADSKTFTSGYDGVGKSIVYYHLENPVISKLENSGDGVTITWGKVSGAVKYRVFRKTGNSGWTKLADTTALIYVDQTAKAGTTYTYTVRCTSANGKTYTSGYDTVGKSIQVVEISLSKPVLKKAEGNGNGVTVSWEKVNGATKYRVFRKTDNSGWVKLADTTALTYTDVTAKAGTKYTYTVRCVSADGKSYTSPFDTAGKSILFTSAPELSSASRVAGGVQVKWEKPAGAVKYRVFRKTGSGGWEKIGETTSTSFTDKTAKSNTQYTYTVRCISEDGKSYTGGYQTAGIAVK